MKLTRSVRARGLSILMLVASLNVAGAAGAQADERRAAARELALEGIGAYDAGKDAQAVDLLQRAEALVHAPTHLLYLGRAYARMGQYVRAREAYHRIMRDRLTPGAPRAFTDAKAAAEKEIVDVEEKIARLTIRLADAPDDLATAVVTLDGTPVPVVLLGVPQPVDPGEHRVEASAPGFRAEPQTITLGAKEKAEVVLRFVPDATAMSKPGSGQAGSTSPAFRGALAPEQPSGEAGAESGSSALRIVGYGALGLGAVGVGAGTLFLLQASGKRSDADDICKQGEGQICPAERRDEIEALDDEAKTATMLSIVSYSVAGASLATGVILLLSGASEEKSAAFTPFFTLDRVGISGRF